MAGQIRAYNRPNDHFTMLANEFVRRPKFPPSAFRIAVFIFSHGADFELDQDGIAQALGIDRSTVSKALGDLEAMQLLIRRRCTDERGHRVADDLFISQREFTESEREALSGKTQRGDSQRGEIPQPKEDQLSKKTNSPRGDADAPATESEDGMLPLPGLPAPAEPVKPEPKGPTPGQLVVAAYVDSYREQTGADPVKSLIGKVAGQAKRLIDDGALVDTLIEAAGEMGHTQYTDLATQLTRVLAARKAKAPVGPRSAEDVDAWLREQWERGRVSEITKRTGITWHLPDIPRDLPPGREALDEFTFQDRRRWIVENRTRILETIARRTGR